MILIIAVGESNKHFALKYFLLRAELAFAIISNEKATITVGG